MLIEPKLTIGTASPAIDLDVPPVPTAVLRCHARGALVVRADSPAGRVYLVRKGQVRLYLLAETGHETTNAVLGPGQLFGIAPLLGYPEYGIFAEALTAVEAWAVPASRLRQALPQDAALLRLVVHALGRRVALAEALLRNVTLLPVAERIPDALRRLDDCLGGETACLTREQLAGLVGARRETVSRAVSPARRPVAARRGRQGRRWAAPVGRFSLALRPARP